MPVITSNADLAKLNDYELILVIAAERSDLIVYGRIAEQIIAACR